MGVLSKFTGGSTPALVALDISSARVKLLELSGSPGHYQVKAYANEPLPNGAVADNQIVEPEAVGLAIKRALERAQTRTRHAAVAVTGSSVISKIIDMPATLSQDEIELQIGFEADQYIPYPIEEVSLDFQVLGPSKHNADMNQVLLAACRRDNVDARLAAIGMAGLKTHLVDVEAYALQNACQLLIDQLPPSVDEQTIAVADFGASTTYVNVLVNRETVYTREQNFGGQQLVEQVQHRYELEPDAAYNKLRSGELPDDFLSEVMPRFAESMAQQIDRSLQFFYSASAQHGSVDQVILVGGCALLPGIAGQVQQHLQAPITVGNPLAGIQATANARRNNIDREASALMVATGLALRGLN